MALIVKPYNQHDAFEKYRENKVKSWESWRDILMNYLRGVFGAKVIIHIMQVSQDSCRVIIYDINNTGTTKEVLTHQVLYIQSDDLRVLEEGGELSVHGVGFDQYFANLLEKDAYSDGKVGITAATQRVGVDGDKVFVQENFDPYDYGTDDGENRLHQYQVDSVDDTDLKFVDGYKPENNFLYLDIPNVKDCDLLGVEHERPVIDILADLTATTFIKALDEKQIEFHFFYTDLNGNITQQSVTEGARLFDEYGNIVKYSSIPVSTFHLAVEHQLTGRYLKSSELTEDVKQNFEREGHRIFGHVPELLKGKGYALEDGWMAWVIDKRSEAGCILGQYGTGNADGFGFSRVFIETSVHNVKTTTEKGNVMLPSSQIIWSTEMDEAGNNKILCPDGKYYRPSQSPPYSQIKEFCKKHDVSSSIKETTRRDVVFEILNGKEPHTDNTFKIKSIHPMVLYKILDVYSLDINTLDNANVVKETSFVDGLVNLDLSVIIRDENGMVIKRIANEWKQNEHQVNHHQIISEIASFHRKHGVYPDEFIISCNSMAEADPRDVDGNFGQTKKSKIVDHVTKLSAEYPEIEFKLMDTRYLELDKPYGNYNNIK